MSFWLVVAAAASASAPTGTFPTNLADWTDWTAAPATHGATLRELAYPVGPDGRLANCQLKVDGRRITGSVPGGCDPQSAVIHARQYLPSPMVNYSSLTYRMSLVEVTSDDYTPPDPAEDSYLLARSRVILSEQGRVISCEQEVLDGPPSWSGLCQAVGPAGTPILPINKIGREREVVVTMTMIGRLR